MSDKKNLAVEIKDLVVEFRTDDGIVQAVNGLDLEIERGKTLGLVGETGAGKTTTGLSILRLIPDPPGKIISGTIKLGGEDIFAKSEKEMEKVLFAVDELSGLIWAAALVRPSKSVQDLELKSVKKKFKDKRFAAGCSRDVIQKGAIIAKTGSTGLAFGDHLHFGILVGGVEVTPLEWLDPKWIKDNITGRLNAQ